MEQVDIDVLRKTNVFLFITGLDITDDDISTLKPIYEGTKKDKEYKIVWIPIVEKWTTELQTKFVTLRSKMPWFTVQTSLTTIGIKFIKKEWNFKGKPTVVSLNPQGRVENPNALHLIRLWGMKAFPYNKTAEETISKERSWISPVVDNIDPVIQTWVIINSHS